MIRLIVIAFALTLATLAQAMPLPQLDKQDGVVTQVRQNCGAGMHYVEGVGCRTTVLRRQTRRCLLFDAGGVCRRWGD
jgi:hypothetical protein